jgi:ABC-type nitrate/sulfonate/bicarbonate transport system permease component
MVKRVLPPLVLLAALIGVWQIVAGSVDPLILSSPAETVRALARDRSLLFDEAGVTALEVVLGLAIAVLLGVAIAVAMHLIRPLRISAYPLLIGSQAIPVVTLAPILILAFGYGIGPKLAMVALVCFFPIAINVLAGLGSVDVELVKLMRVLGASRWTRLWKAELPASLPFFFGGLKLAAVFAVIGAVFGEWAGADRGLGRLILLANNQLQTPRVYAGVVLLTAMAIVLFVAVVVAERLAVPWKGRT